MMPHRRRSTVNELQGNLRVYRTEVHARALYHIQTPQMLGHHSPPRMSRRQTDRPAHEQDSQPSPYLRGEVELC